MSLSVEYLAAYKISLRAQLLLLVAEALIRPCLRDLVALHLLFVLLDHHLFFFLVSQINTRDMWDDSWMVDLEGDLVLTDR